MKVTGVFMLLKSIAVKIIDKRRVKEGSFEI